MTTIGESGEFSFIDRISKTLGTDADLLLGTGDDCAVIRCGESTWVVSTDLSVEDVHFFPEANPDDVGWKAMSAALSDIAAMGCLPKFALVSISVDSNRPLTYLDSLYTGLNAAASKHGAVIIGGDTTRNPSGLAIDVTVMGEAPDGRYLTRAGAQHGDRLFVTGWPGRSRAGLDAIQRGLEFSGLINAHSRPEARIQAGLWLGAREGVRALMDVSDGLAQDCGHLATASALGISLDSSCLPLDTELAAYCSDTGANMAEVMFSGGEDYELLFAVAAPFAADLIREGRSNLDVPLHAVGEFTNSFEGVRIDGRAVEKSGFDHFR